MPFSFSPSSVSLPSSPASASVNSNPLTMLSELVNINLNQQNLKIAHTPPPKKPSWIFKKTSPTSNS